MQKITKNNWDNIEYEGWAKRENKIWKIRYDLIPIEYIKRIAWLYTRWAEIYWVRNWEKGVSEEYIDKMKQSLWRHFIQYLDWDTDEDHLAAVCFNLFWHDFLTNKLKEKNSNIINNLIK
jgi:hypothetical protein